MFNHFYCSEIVKLLKEWDADWNTEGEEGLDTDKIKFYAKQIMDRGGLQALSMNFSAMQRYLSNNNETLLKVLYLKQIFNGVTSDDGEVWRN